MAGKSAVASGQFEVLRDRMRHGGALWLLGKAFKRLGINVAWILLLPLACLLHAIGFRRLTINTDRVGHLTCEPDCFLKLKALGRLPRRRFWFVLAPPGRVANRHLLTYWQSHLTFVTNSLACRLLHALCLRGPMVHSVDDYILNFGSSATYYAVNNTWDGRPPLLHLTADDREELAALLAGLGAPEGAWFVCFHSREGGYSPADEVIHAHRNAPIGTYVEAMSYVASLGGWCIRMGDPSMNPLPVTNNVIDYAHHPLRSERADVLLCGGCKFFVGCSSGLWNLASVFGVPSALANMIPVSTLGYSPTDLSIPKLLCRRDDGRVLCFKEVFGLGLANLRTASAYERAGVRVIENGAEDIRDLAMDLYEKIQGVAEDLPGDEGLQKAFRTLLRPHDYGFDAGAGVSPRFLRRYRHLVQGGLADHG